MNIGANNYRSASQIKFFIIWEINLGRGFDNSSLISQKKKENNGKETDTDFWNMIENQKDC